jgi:hypothetical protein
MHLKITRFDCLHCGHSNVRRSFPDWSRSIRASSIAEAQLQMCEHKSTENASSQSRPCAKISTMSDNRSWDVNLSRRIALAPRTRRRSRPHGAHRGGLGQVNSAGRDVAEYNLERKCTSSTSSAGLPKRRAVDTYPCDALWLGLPWPCMSLDRYT